MLVSTWYKEWGPRNLSLSYIHALKAKMKGALIGYYGAMVTYHVLKNTAMNEHSFDIIIVVNW